jgi:hypothetical protein
MHDEIAAARVGERLGALQFRARRRLEARHSCCSFGGLCGSRHNGRSKKKGEQEKVLAANSYDPELSDWSRRAAYSEIGDKVTPMSLAFRLVTVTVPMSLTDSCFASLANLIRSNEARFAFAVA